MYIFIYLNRWLRRSLTPRPSSRGLKLMLVAVCPRGVVQGASWLIYYIIYYLILYII